MEIDALRSLLAFVDTGSFTRAAKQIHRTQSAVSMQMKKLEADIGKILFVKQGRKLSLTQDGQILLSHARQLVQLHDDTLLQMKRDTPNTLIRLGCPDDYAESVLPLLSQILHKKFLNVDLQITCTPSNRVKLMLESGHLDLGIVSRSPESEEGHLLQTDRGIWIGVEDYDLDNDKILNLAVFQKDCRFRQAVFEGLQKKNVPFKVYASCGSAEALRGIVQQSLAIGALAEMSRGTLNEINHPRLPALPTAEIVLIRSNNANSPVTQDMMLSITELYKSALQSRPPIFS